MPRGGKRPGAGRPKGTTKEGGAAKSLVVTQQMLGSEDPLLRALNALGDEFNALDFLKASYKCKEAPLDVRFVAATKAVQFEVAKPTANKAQGAGGIVFNFARRHVNAT